MDITETLINSHDTNSKTLQVYIIKEYPGLRILKSKFHDCLQWDKTYLYRGVVFKTLDKAIEHIDKLEKEIKDRKF